MAIKFSKCDICGLHLPCGLESSSWVSTSAHSMLWGALIDLLSTDCCPPSLSLKGPVHPWTSTQTKRVLQFLGSPNHHLWSWTCKSTLDLGPHMCSDPSLSPHKVLLFFSLIGNHSLICTHFSFFSQHIHFLVRMQQFKSCSIFLPLLFSFSPQRHSPSLGLHYLPR